MTVKCRVLLDFGNADYVVGEVYDLPEADANMLVRWGIVEILPTEPAPELAPPEPPPATTTTTAKTATTATKTTTADTTDTTTTAAK
ncbi:MAG: hypothetical protein ACRCZS_08860 [Chroococcidiopsis sp.]